ncbi:MAG: helix-turn-helix domain-containing protein [Deltaproteobacteria bacterium]|jgi:predicted ArsR family transcriptional regulator|nr:helix-turn-helix domain-containing protein [Deltaproteobacteria bacterium]
MTGAGQESGPVAPAGTAAGRIMYLRTMSTDTFDEQIETITGALGDATRRGIYVIIREAHEPVTAAQIAQAFDIHPNVARHHLDRLFENGFIRVSDRKPSQPTAGRPAKRYEVTDKAVSLQYSSRKYDQLAELLTSIIEQLDDGSALTIAERVGHDYGRRLGTEIGIPDDEGYEMAALAVARAMMGEGLGASTVPGENRIVAQFCPLAGDEPSEIIARIDHGIVQGLLESAAERPVEIEVGHPDH